MVSCNHPRMNTQTGRPLLFGTGVTLIDVRFDMAITFVTGSGTC
jgi:hypothetical protein